MATLSVDAPRPMLRVLFDQIGDRIAHRIEACDAAGDWQTVLASIEGEADDVWPASPVVQEVHLEDRADGARVALCVGRAGKSHWSLGVTLAGDGRTLVFQSACRIRDTPQSLGSTYDAVNVDQLARVKLEPASTASLQKEANCLLFSPSALVQQPPETIAWDFVVELEPPQ